MNPWPAVSVVIPAKDTRWAKTRLGLEDSARQAMARQLMESTTRAALAATTVHSVFVVTSDDFLAAVADSLGAVVVEETGVSGLNAAAERGRTRALSQCPRHAVAVLVADLPFLRPAHLDVLAEEFAGRRHPLHVTDHRGVGTTVLIHGPHVRPTIAFGGSSSAAHARHGFAAARRAPMGLRTDLDDGEDLVRATSSSESIAGGRSWACS